MVNFLILLIAAPFVFLLLSATLHGVVAIGESFEQINPKLKVALTVLVVLAVSVVVGW